MELDDLKQAWQTLDRRLEHQLSQKGWLVQELQTRKTRSRLRPLIFAQTLQIIAGVLLVALSASFWIKYLHEPHLLVEGLLLHGYGLMMIAFAVRDLVLVGQIDYAAPVITIQTQLTRLGAWRIRCALWFAATWCLVWIPLALVLLYGQGVDLWVAAPATVYWSFASSAVSLGLIYALFRWSRHPGGAWLRRFFDDSFAGRSVTRAHAALEEIAQFERE
ncbi:MAG: hypothetical protein ABI858_07990 [Pseudoxanthomonas sp.]